MENLISHIDYLMSRNDCVIIPGIGALLARYVSARIDSANGVAYPPHREFSFNSGLVYNDGMLAHSYARALDIPYDMALAKVNEAVSKLNSALHTHGCVELGRIGVLASNGSLLDFIPARDSYELSLLPRVECAPSQACQSSMELGIADASAQGMRFGLRLRQAARIAASIALLIGICFIASTPIKVDDAALASLSPEFRQATIEDIMAVDQCEPDEQYTINVTGIDGGYLSIDVTAAAKQASGNDKRYYLIVGSFNSSSEANRFVEMHPEQHLAILEGKAVYRIYAGSYDNATEAMEALRSTDFRATGAWVSHQ